MRDHREIEWEKEKQDKRTALDKRIERLEFKLLSLEAERQDVLERIADYKKRKREI